MTKDDKIFLIHFVTRTGMYINPVDIHNIQSFVTGYEIGRKGKCRFYELSKNLLSTKYKIKYLSDGFIGQIKRLAEKQSISEVVVFKNIAIETIALDELDIEVGKVLKSRVAELINRIDKAGHPWYNETWKDSWLSLVFVTKAWYRQLWSKEEFSIIKAIEKEVLIGNMFNSYRGKTPSNKMLEIKVKYDQINCT
ncbi:hypothetical protein ESA94_03415 [Lacibacter luteus]|uniref:Uncharacterized protein n=1 Tax=Lacibacter luteus TaxID=2508719 RepID=A0A4Q1CM27_9BACT|nr:hypothetical protein [Lacibacter luteus]RXK62073.1 hypothetical protein ESA94_03415 [Lacibacter luteus]